MIDDITASLERRLHTTPHDVMVSEALIAIRALITERDGARALCAEYQAAHKMCEKRVAALHAIARAARAFRAAYHGDPAVVSLAAAWAALEAALEGVGDGH